MRFKLDENLGTRISELFHNAEFIFKTVRDQNLPGCSDQQLYEVCCAEQMFLVTLDLDFAEVTRFPPDKLGGIAILRLPRHSSYALLKQLVSEFIEATTKLPLEKKLCIVEIGRIRIHESEQEEK